MTTSYDVDATVAELRARITELEASLEKAEARVAELAAVIRQHGYEIEAREREEG